MERAAAGCATEHKAILLGYGVRLPFDSASGRCQEPGPHVLNKGWDGR